MARVNKPSSPYYTTSVRDFYLDLLALRPVAPSSNDKLVTITPKYEKRPDLLANDLYGSPRLWWLFAARNMDILVDPIEDFVAGVTIYTPAPEQVEGYL